MTHSEVERKDGVPKKHDQKKKNEHMKAHKSKIERKASHIQQVQKEREVIFGVNIIHFHIFHSIH